MMPMGEDSPNLITVGTKALLDNANRLGLTWRMRLATVNTSGAAPTVTMDGDTEPIGAVPMSGNPAAGARVYVITIPPAGNYIVGQVAQQETGVESITFASATTNTTAVAFDRPFLSVPRVVTNIDSGAGAQAFWHPRAIDITTTGFNLFVFRQSGLAANAWSNVPVSWIAMAP